MKNSIRIFALVLAMALCLAQVATAADLPAYQVKVTSKMGTMKMAIDGFLQAPVDEATLKAVAEKAYRENGGPSFERVFIMWYLPHYKVGAGAWATTNVAGGTMDVKILRLQDL